MRYMVAGGLAVNAHGYLRFTQDVDLVIALSLRQKLLALEEMTEIAEHFGRLHAMGKMRGPTAPKKNT